MAFNKLKKWVGTQLWSTFMTEYNENIDELNRVISENEAHNSLFTYRQLSIPADSEVLVGLRYRTVNYPTIPGYVPFYGIVKNASHLDHVMWCIHVAYGTTVYAQSYAPAATLSGVTFLLWYIKTT